VRLEPGISLAEAERQLIERTLSMHGGDKRAAAETLGISLRTLYNRLASYSKDADA
jgi:DNA-binding NtrC family response regulator